MPEKPSDQALANRVYWDRTSDEYQERHREFIGRPEPRWGVWQIPEAELQVLGDVDGKDVLELGCGAAQWSILLAKQGARPVGLDNSERQLEHARERLDQAGVDFPLIHSSAEDVPLPDGSFDIVFCDHGAFTFADPRKLVPEAARLLRPGGLLAFSHSSPFVAVTIQIPCAFQVAPVIPCIASNNILPPVAAPVGREGTPWTRGVNSASLHGDAPSLVAYRAAWP